MGGARLALLLGGLGLAGAAPARAGHLENLRPEHAQVSVTQHGASVLQHGSIHGRLPGSVIAEIGAEGEIDVLGRKLAQSTVPRVPGQRALPVMRAEHGPAASHPAPPARHDGQQHGAAPHAIQAASPVAAAALLASRVVATFGGARQRAARKPDGQIMEAPSEAHPLPAGAQIVLGIAMMLLLTTCYYTVASKIRNPVPGGADSEDLEEVLEAAMDRMHELELELEGRQEVDAMFEESDSEADEAQQSEKEKERRAREIQDAASRVADVPQQLFTSANRVQSAFNATLGATRARIETFARSETASLYGDVNAAVEEDAASIPRWQPPDWMTEQGTLVLPPVMQLVSGMFAHSQIQSTRYFNAAWLVVSVIMVTCSVVAFVIDWNTKCTDDWLWAWHIGLLTLTTLDLLCRLRIVSKCSKALNFLRLQRKQLEKESASGAGTGIFDRFADLQRKSKKFFDGFFRYQLIIEAWSYLLSKLLSFLSLVWGGFGLAISIQNIVKDTLGCDARFAVHYLHTCSFVFVLLLTWNILAQLFWLVYLLSGSSFVRTPIVKLAKYIDDDLMRGTPVALSLVQSLVLKDSAEVLHLKENQVLHEMEELRQQVLDLEERLAQRKRAQVRVRDLSRQAPSEQEFMERCQQRVAAGLDEIKPVVGLVAAHVTTTEGPDPTAAGSGQPAGRRGAMPSVPEDAPVESF